MSRKGTNHLRSVDQKLARVIDAAGSFRLKSVAERSPFESLAESIAYQQLNGKAAATIWGRVIDLYGGGKLAKPAVVLKTPHAKLRAAGLSENKVLALKDLAQKACDGIVPTRAKIEKLDDEEIIERLTEVRGIGRWTVEMLLIFSLHRLDVLPATDYGVQQGFKLTYNKRALPKPKDLLSYGEIWRPYRSIASWYMWRAVDLSREKPGGGRG